MIGRVQVEDQRLAEGEARREALSLSRSPSRSRSRSLALSPSLLPPTPPLHSRYLPSRSHSHSLTLTLTHSLPLSLSLSNRSIPYTHARARTGVWRRVRRSRRPRAAGSSRHAATSTTCPIRVTYPSHPSESSIRVAHPNHPIRALRSESSDPSHRNSRVPARLPVQAAGSGRRSAACAACAR